MVVQCATAGGLAEVRATQLRKDIDTLVSRQRGGGWAWCHLVAGYAAPPEPEPQPERHLEASRPGALVQFDCFHVGRLSGSKGTVWQYTAIDVASSYTWAELHTTPRNPSSRWTSHLARRVASDLAARGWQLETVMTDIQSGCALAMVTGAAGRSQDRRVRRLPAVVA